jgi:uncharacterized Ntn-hydrolase superfamily protein
VTYSIVARDPSTGELGVAVQSHYFSVGTVVPWARSGVGAVATQAMANITYGPLGLELMTGGVPAPKALESLLLADDGRETRQVAMVDAKGTAATHTGAQCIAEAGHHTGDGWSVQANMMLRDTVPEAMAESYRKGLANGTDLTGRLLDALDAAEAEGGDIRGRQSAAILVVKGATTGRRWEDVITDVRIDDHDEPLLELRRVVAVRQAYDRAGKGDYDDSIASAMGRNPELAYWHGLRLAMGGQVDEARPFLDEAFAIHEGWAELLRRLPASGLFPDDPELMARVLGSHP